MNSETREQPSPGNLRILAITNFFLISLMLSFFAFVLGKSVTILYPGWHPIGFMVMAFFVAFESLSLRYYQRRTSRFTQNIVLGILSEIILIILVAKLFSMLSEGFSTLWMQITSWQEDFIGNFLDSKSTFYIFGILFIWMMTWLFSGPINKLEEDHELMEQEKLGVVFTDRRDARKKLVNLIFILGFIMIFLASSINYFFASQAIDQTNSSPILPVLILYFAAGFVFLSLNQYAIMKAYWYFNDISVNPDLIKRWIFYTVLFIIFVVSVIIFLPKDFSIEINQFVEFLYRVIIYIFSILQFLIIFPIILIITLLSSLFSGEPIQEQIQDQVQEYQPVIPQPAGQMPWIEVVKTILFWAVFLVIIIFTIRFYIKNNIRIRSLFRNFPLASWIKDFWNWIKKGFLLLKQETASKYQSGIENIRRYLKERGRNLPKLSNILNIMPPRQEIIMTYLEWIRWNNEMGLIRRKSQTPLEFAQVCTQFNNEASVMIDDFTNYFITARYSTHPIEKEQAQEARRLLSKLQETFQLKHDEQEAESE